jgi:leader peptidase (prepilin peptidase)/N-methyltransferase
MMAEVEAARWLLPVGGILLFVLGAVFGSFLNVCIHRLPRGESVVSPASRCPRCGAPIRWWQNVPVGSWLLLRGRCASCGKPISLRYPFVEALNGLLWLAAWLKFGAQPETLVFLPFLSGMVVLFFTDLDEQLLPDVVTYPLAVAGLVLAAWNVRLDLAPGWLGSGSPLGRVVSALAGAALGAGVFVVMMVVWKALFVRAALGWGDPQLLLGVGAFTGIPGVVLTILLASVAGTLVNLPLLLAGRRRMTSEVPFGCYLTPVAVFAVFYGNEIVRWYLSLLRWPGVV